MHHRIAPIYQIGETYAMGKGLVAKAFKTYHVIPSQVCFENTNKSKHAQAY